MNQAAARKFAYRDDNRLCFGCGHKPCTCKTLDKLRNRLKGVGTNEAREPFRTKPI